MTPARARQRCFTLVLVCGLGLGCHHEPPVATTLEAAGPAERGRSDGWASVAFGTTFVVGDTLRTGAAGRVRLGLAGGGVLRVGERARLRFQRGAAVGQQAPDIAVELGAAEVEEVVSGLSILTAIGPARLERGARVRVRADGGSASLEVIVGRAVMLEAGQEVAIDAGHGVRIRLGNPEIERFALKVGDAVVEGQAPAGDDTRAGSDRSPDGGAVAAGAPGERLDGGPATAGPEGQTPTPEAPVSHGTRGESARADITVVAGESATVHDGRTPAVVRMRTDGVCPGEAIVELGGHGHRREQLVGARAVVVRLKPGALPYRVRCANDGGEPRASGVLSLRRDTGYVPLARRAPANVIDADGRRYTVLFQTRLPQLTLAWPAAPAGRLELHLDSTAGERVIDAASPMRPLPSGTVQEGTYTFWYRAADGKQSPRTTVVIRFDNAAPTAQFFRTPPASGNGLPRTIAVDGVTVEGAKVTVGGKPLAVDTHGRFRTEATPFPGDDAVAVRLEHPRTGIHYYVRRGATAP